LTVRRAALLGIVLLAFVLRVAGLDRAEMSGDEAFVYLFSLNPYPGLASKLLAVGEPHPPGYFWLQRAWTNAVGCSEFALRYSNVCFSVLAIPLVYGLGRRLRLGLRIAVLAALLLSINPFSIWHSQDARMYTVSTTLCLASSYALVCALRGARAWPWAATIGLAWSAIMVHCASVLVVSAQALAVAAWALYGQEPRRELRRIALALGALTILSLPWFLAAAPALGAYAGTREIAPLLPAVWRPLGALAIGLTSPGRQRMAAALAGIGLSILFLLSADDRQLRRAATFLLLSVGLPILAMWAAARFRPVFDERYVIAALPAFLLLLAAGAWARSSARSGWRVRRLLGVGLLATVPSLGVASLGRFYWSPDPARSPGWRELAAALTDLTAGLPPNEALIVENFPDPALWYYYRGSARRTVLPAAPGNLSGAEAEVERLASDGVRWALLPLQPAPYWDADGIAARALSARFQLIAQRRVGSWPLQIYVRIRDELPERGDLFGSRLRLVGAEFEPVSVAPGGVVAVHLRWNAEARSVEGEIHVTAQVIDSGGHLVAQSDGPPAISGEPELRLLTMPVDLRPGSYAVILAAYRVNAAGRPRLLTASANDHVRLGALTVR
jgi:hypothetical protein